MPALADDGHRFWLGYDLVRDQPLRERFRRQCLEVVVLGRSEVLDAAREELLRGLEGMLGRAPTVTSEVSRDGAIVIAGSEQGGKVADLGEFSSDGYVIRSVRMAGKKATLIAGRTDRGALYGAFRFLSLLQTRESLNDLRIKDEPAIGLRMADQWDNPRGDVERGYAGPSIFQWERLPDLDERYTDYARMLASVGINGIVLNNVNTAKGGLTGWKLITTPYLQKTAALAAVFRRYGIRTFLSVNFASPMLIGGLKTADPLDPAVQQWWRAKAREIYACIPNFGGILVKADSEGEPGPLTYERNHAQGANMLAAAFEPLGGLVIWRAFVYGKQHNPDRVMQAYEIFQPLDGTFAPNVTIQIKNGPLDFQVHEPVSPLFGAMPKTNQMLELQVTQEYTGQATHMVYLVPQWKEILSFDTFAQGRNSTVGGVVGGLSFDTRHSGIAGVMNIGSDRNWTGHLLAQANTYGYGRLAWNPNLSAEAITHEWVLMTFGTDPQVVNTISAMLLRSWKVYEDYTAPLGLGFLSDSEHFHPGPAHRQLLHKADANGVGYDRTRSSGSGFAGQYHSPWKESYDSLATCPEELLLWFHHVPYLHRLKSGKTVIQHIYDSHFDGVEQVRSFQADWKKLRGRIDPERYSQVMARLQEQLAAAIEWRDTINRYFFELSGIPDSKGRITNTRHN
jgi:alpha-glucuronidase